MNAETTTKIARMRELFIQANRTMSVRDWSIVKRYIHEQVRLFGRGLESGIQAGFTNYVDTYGIDVPVTTAEFKAIKRRCRVIGRRTDSDWQYVFERYYYEKFTLLGKRILVVN